MKCFFSEELEMDRSILFQHLHIGLCLDDLTHFKMMHSFQRFSFCRLLDGITSGNPVSRSGRGRALSISVVRVVELCCSQLLHISCLCVLLILQQRRPCPGLTGSCPHLTGQALLVQLAFTGRHYCFVPIISTLSSLHPASLGLRK